MDEPQTYEDFHRGEIVHSDSEEHVLFIARVSSNQDNKDPKLLRWLIEKRHWSPFEMVGACIEINTTRDIGRQVLRHRSFSFQEFSGRYAAYDQPIGQREVRFKGDTNRQGSVRDSANGETQHHFEQQMRAVASDCFRLYQTMLNMNVAPECARAVLPEGLVPTKMYMNGTLRSWIHYLKERMAINPDNGLPWAQREHYWIARDIYDRLGNLFPVTWTALIDMDYIDTPDYSI